MLETIEQNATMQTVAQQPRLLDQVRAAIRTRHYSLRTEQAYLHWIKRFIFFHDKRHPKDMGAQVPCVYLFHHPGIYKSIA